MMYTIKIITLVFMLLCSSSKICSQNSTYLNNAEKKATFEKAINRPDLAVNFSNVAKLKVFVRKNVYSFQEMMILDVAMLTTTKSELYFPDLLKAQIKIRSKSRIVNVYPYLITSTRFSPELLKGKLVSKSFNLIIGCKAEKQNILNVLESDDDKIIFENNLFRTYGDACIDIRKSGIYEISVEILNDSVVISEDKEKYQTAIGKVKSKALRINVNR